MGEGKPLLTSSCISSTSEGFCIAPVEMPHFQSSSRMIFTGSFWRLLFARVAALTPCARRSLPTEALRSSSVLSCENELEAPAPLPALSLQDPKFLYYTLHNYSLVSDSEHSLTTTLYFGILVLQGAAEDERPQKQPEEARPAVSL